MTRRPTSDIVTTVEELLEHEGVHAALRFLNQRAPHRFTGVYRLQPPQLRNVCLFDRKNPELRMAADAPLRETYCSMVGQTGEPVGIADSAADPRTTEHPARHSTLSYSGVPLRDDEGTVWGTLCHFDVVPQPVPDDELALLQAVAPRILAALRREGTLSGPEHFHTGPPSAGG